MVMNLMNLTRGYVSPTSNYMLQYANWVRQTPIGMCYTGRGALSSQALAVCQWNLLVECKTSWFQLQKWILSLSIMELHFICKCKPCYVTGVAGVLAPLNRSIHHDVTTIIDVLPGGKSEWHH